MPRDPARRPAARVGGPPRSNRSTIGGSLRSPTRTAGPKVTSSVASSVISWAARTHSPSAGGQPVRKTTTGLLSLALAAGLGATMTAPIAAASAAKAPSQSPLGEPQAAPRATACPTPSPRSRPSCARRPSPRCSRARPRRRRSATAPSSRSARPSGPPRPRRAPRRRRRRRRSTSTSSSPARTPTSCSCCVVQFGNERHPSYPDQDTNPDIPGPVALRRAPVQPDPRARPHGRQLHRLVPELRQGLLPGPLLRQRVRHRHRVDAAVLREAVLRSLLASPAWSPTR